MREEGEGEGRRKPMSLTPCSGLWALSQPRLQLYLPGQRVEAGTHWHPSPRGSKGPSLHSLGMSRSGGHGGSWK